MTISKSEMKAKRLISLIGLKRSDSRIIEAIDWFGTTPEISIDKEDGADDEYVEFKEMGIVFYFEEDLLVSIFLHSASAGPDYSKYIHPLPMGISYEKSKAEVIDLLGTPDLTGGGYEDDFFNHRIPDWIKYEFADYALHVEFNQDQNSVQMVTIMLKAI